MMALPAAGRGRGRTLPAWATQTAGGWGPATPNALPPGWGDGKPDPRGVSLMDALLMAVLLALPLALPLALFLALLAVLVSVRS